MVSAAPVFSLMDNTESTLSLGRLVNTQPRDLAAVAARLGAQFVASNRSRFDQLSVRAELVHSGTEPRVHLRSSHAVGSVGLVSPTTGRDDLGLVIRPRFSWPSLGSVLSDCGMRVLPQLLPLPQLPYSEREVPRWVLSSVVLARVEALIRTVRPQFRMTESEVPFPKGTVNWERWAVSRLGAAKPLELPCRFPDLDIDRDILGFVHRVLLLQKSSLLSQSSNMTTARTLLAVCDQLLAAVARIPPQSVTSDVVNQWMRRPLAGSAFRDGLTAGLWTMEERGLGGRADLSGLAWRLDMEVVFESWVAAQLARWAGQNGFQFRADRDGETQIPIRWEPPYRGSQKSLRPDFVLRRDGHALIVDAKYKGHWDDLNATAWGNVEADIQEAHRADLLQVLAYASAFDEPHVVCALVYPCREDTWDALSGKGLTVNRATISRGRQEIEIALMAVPFAAKAGDVRRVFDLALLGQPSDVRPLL